MCHSVCVHNSNRTLQVKTGEMVTQHKTLSALVVVFVCLSSVNCTQQRESFVSYLFRKNTYNRTFTVYTLTCIILEL